MRNQGRVNRELVNSPRNPGCHPLSLGTVVMIVWL